jgi:hypothetical protein
LGNHGEGEDPPLGLILHIQYPDTSQNNQGAKTKRWNSMEILATSFGKLMYALWV